MATSETQHAPHSRRVRRLAARRWSWSSEAHARVLVLVLFVAVASLPLLGSTLRDDVEPPGHLSWFVRIGWMVVGVLGAVVVTHIGQRLLPARCVSLALAYDGLPLLLVPAWIVAGGSAISGHWLLAAIATGLCCYHVYVVLPRLQATPTPAWVMGSPLIDVCVANVYTKNRTPAKAAAQLIATGADVIVIVESTPRFMHCFDQVGGTRRYPHRLTDPDDDSEYAVTIASVAPLGEGSQFEADGTLKIARARLRVGTRTVTLLGLNPSAIVDRGGFRIWRSQLERLTESVATSPAPLMIAGDLNSSRFRPEFAQLLESAHLCDVYDTMGAGLRPSFRLAATGALSAIGPIVRLDHALIDADLHPVRLVDLAPCGSDHTPFVVTLAVRQDLADDQAGTA